MTGTVKFFNDEKGYGFITNNETHEDVFVHFTAIKAEGHRTLTKGQVVTYDVEKDPRTDKIRACNVSL